MTLKRALRAGWSVKIWPHYNGYSAVFDKQGEVTRIGRGSTAKKAVKVAFIGHS